MDELGLVEDEAAEASALSCQRTQTRSSLDCSSGSRSWMEAKAMKMSERTPVGMSQTKVSRLAILATARATRVPSILPLSLVIMYSATQSSGPLPKENFLMYRA
ncbi:hypothetical protein VDGD_21339 [Verticillium dahliae]|nr:hypothetical protein VDGD_21339 [Verticillium dahliae]